MTRRHWLIAVGVTVLVVAALVTAISTLGRGFAGSVDIWFVLVTLALGAAFGAVGALLIALRTAGPLGPLLAVSGTALVVQMAFREIAYDALVNDSTALGYRVLAWSTTWLDVLGLPLPLVLLLLWFPDGRLPSRRWIPVAVAAVGVGVVQLLRYLLGPGPVRLGSHGLVVPWRGLVPLSEPALTAVDEVTGQLTILLLLVAAVSLIVRFVRGDADTRRRLTLLGLAVATILLGAGLQAFDPLDSVGVVLFVVGGALVPVALILGALRYGLWDLDPLLVRAISYAGLAAGVGALYVLVVQLVVLVLGDRVQTTTTIPNVVATVAVALLFAPAKERLERVARRLVYGERATPYQTLSALPQRLVDAPAVDEVLPAIAESLARGLGAASAGVRVNIDPDPTQPDRTVWYPGPPDPEDPIDRVEVRHLGAHVGELLVATRPGRPLTRDDRRLLGDLAAQCGAAIRAVHLADELAARLDQITAQSAELSASRQRLVVAQSQERIRLQHDLHDGVQQRLVAARMQLASIRPLVRTDPDAALAELGRAAESLETSLDEIREVSRGLHPSTLVARGLLASLRTRVEVSRQPVALHGDGLDGVRLDPEIEAAAYYACLEALQNAAKHAPNARVSLHLELTDDRLRWMVSDDGPGFDAGVHRTAGGLTGMRDRLAALGGILEVASNGPGTRIRGSLPRTLEPRG